MMIEGSLRMEDKSSSSFVEDTVIMEGDRQEETSIQVNAMACSSSSWIVDMENILRDANPSVEMVQWEKTSIYRVPEWIKDLTNEKAYRPWLVSLGPFHHGEPGLMRMEEHKRRAVLHLVKRSGRPLRDFVATIEHVADKLREAYQGLDEKWRGDEKGCFVEMMVTDGCFLLEVMRADALRMNGQADDDYAANDPVFSQYGLNNLFGAIRADLVVIENQLPLLAIEELMTVRDGIRSIAQENNNNMCRFLGVPCFFSRMDDLGLHPLDIFHSSLCGGRPQHEESGEGDVIIPTASELHEAGVHFKKSNGPWVHDVGFENGVLSIPELAVAVDHSTAKELLNLRVFEQLHLTVGNDVTNYLIFMGSLINSERDTGLLRSKGIMSSLISDKELADLFNNLTNGAISSQTKNWKDVAQKVKAHCATRRNMWRTYLNNRWVFTSLVAATILLVATLTQTIYTVVPFYLKK